MRLVKSSSTINVFIGGGLSLRRTGAAFCRGRRPASEFIGDV
jgi:hypothetical protein